MGEEDARCEGSCDSTGRAVGRIRTARTGPATRGAQGCQIRECTIVDAGGFRKKSGDLVRERQAVKFAAIADWADLGTYPVVFMCAELEVSRSGYYAWRVGGPSARAVADQGFTVMIKAIYDQGRGNPGVRRVRAGLAALGHLLSHKRVWRLMRAAGLQGRHPKAWKRTTVHGDHPVTAPDLIKRDFTAGSPNRRWCGDIERHEALLNRAVMKGHRLRLVAASRKKLRAA